jgi:hypothetical protein
VTRNGVRVRGVETLYEGDKVATGPGSRARADIGQGSVELGENTDPHFTRRGACVVVRILFGQVVASGLGLCLDDGDGPLVELSSVVHVSVPRGGPTVVTVLDGSVRLVRLEQPEILRELQRVTISGRTLQNRATISRSQAVELSRLRMTPRTDRLKTPPVR